MKMSLYCMVVDEMYRFNPSQCYFFSKIYSAKGEIGIILSERVLKRPRIC
jgi:hypothetical protein